ncbi:MAG TPA: alpha/beta hydrolase-fold protein [Rhizomicrobium sp.]
MSRPDVVTEMFAYDGGRQVTAYIPPGPPGAVVFAADGVWHAAQLVESLRAAGASSTLVVGVDGKPDDEGRLKEYVPAVEPERFAAHERFFVDDVRAWMRSSLGIAFPPARTAVWGASLGGELALALGLRHPEIYGVVFSASPGGGFRPTATLPATLPRAYLVAGSEEQFFLDNATRWVEAFRAANADAILKERPGSHGGAFWYDEFPLMTRWAFGG